MSPGRCGLCGADPAEGWAQGGDVWFCHGDGPGMTCYEARQMGLLTAAETAEYRAANPAFDERIKETGRELLARLRAEGPLP